MLFKTKKNRTESQNKRADILFKKYPDIQHAHELLMMFKNTYETSKSIQEAYINFNEWFKKIKQYNYPAFVT